MISFLTGCVGLFSGTLNAANALEYFRLLMAVVLLQVLVGVFLYLYRGTKKL